MEQWWQGVRNDRKPGQHAHVVYESDGGDVEGYLRYEVRPKWDAGLASHSLAEHDFVTLTPRSRQALWRHVLDVDLVRAVHMGGQPVDDPIRWWLANPRAMKVTRYGDFFWTRILHIERSLEARHYRADTALVIEIRDALFPDNSGRYALTIDAGVASCERTEKAPDLVMPIASLGSLFLGGVTASNLARGGQIEERSDGALARCDAAFSSDVQPWSATWF
jgi:predicted acetyltransferase